MNTKKNENAEIRNKRSGLFQLGLVSAMAICLCAFEYTTFENKEVSIRGTVIPDEIMDEKVLDIDLEIPKPKEPQPEQRNDNRPAGPSNAPSAVNINVVNHLVNPNQNLPNIGDPTDSVVIGGGFTEDVIVEEDFTIVEDMPYCVECASIKDKQQREQCTQQNMFKTFSKYLKYPAFPKENNISGTVFVSFRINKNGKVDDAQVIRGVQKDLDAEALRVVNKLPDMIPGQQRGKAVNVRYTVPIKFTLRN